jgi:CBS domain containing-hemolysin-like protein
MLVGGGLTVFFAVLESGLSAVGDVRLKAMAEESTGRSALGAGRILEHRDWIETRAHAGLVASLMALVAGAFLAFAGRGSLWGVGASASAVFAYLSVQALLKAWIHRTAGRQFVAFTYALRSLEWLASPVALPLLLIRRAVARAVPDVMETDAERITALHVEHAIDVGEEEGGLEEPQADLLRSVMEFENTVAREVMVPRTSAAAIEIETPLDEVLRLIVDSGHSRYPVYRDRVDQIEGVLCAKDLFRVIRENEEMDSIRIADLVRRPTLFVPEMQKIGSLLRTMQVRSVHLAVVVDEFGGTSGIITLEDILEEIVGEIRDEHDHEEPPVVELSPGRFLADAGLSISDLEEVVGEGVFAGVEGEFDSIGGLISSVTGRVPTVGETLEAGGFEITVREADERRVLRVELVATAEAQPDVA